MKTVYLLQREDIGLSRKESFYDYYLIKTDIPPVDSQTKSLTEEGVNQVSKLSGLPEFTKEFLECENGIYSLWSVVATDSKAIEISKLMKKRKEVTLKLESLGVHPESETLME